MLTPQQLQELTKNIVFWAAELGFEQVGISDIQLQSHKEKITQWLSKKYHGDMAWLEDNMDKRLDPSLLVTDACRSISVRMNYLPHNSEHIKVLKTPEKAYLSRYALGRDYHKVIRKRLAKLANKIEDYVSSTLESSTLDTHNTTMLSQRAFVDSAPVLERPLAEKAGLGWVGKHTLLINKHEGSWFFLGELITNIPLLVNTQIEKNHCGDCSACLKVCPTDAFPKPYELDARRCISYLTIENKGPIPEEFRSAMGNRVFGCDDCQAICPWNKYAASTCEKDFKPRHGLDSTNLTSLFEWSEKEFEEKTAGSPIRRIGYERWQRNLAIGLGNAPKSELAVSALIQKLPKSTPLVAEHIEWAIDQQQSTARPRKRKLRNKNKDITE